MDIKVNLYNGTGYNASFQIYYKDDTMDDYKSLFSKYIDSGQTHVYTIPFKSTNPSSRTAYLNMLMKEADGPPGRYICGTQALVIDNALLNNNLSTTNLLIYYSNASISRCDVPIGILFQNSDLNGYLLTSDSKYPLSCINYNSSYPFVLIPFNNDLVESNGVSFITDPVINLDDYSQPDPCTINYGSENNNDESPTNGDDNNESSTSQNNTYYIIIIFLVIILIIIIAAVIGGGLYYYKKM